MKNPKSCQNTQKINLENLTIDLQKRRNISKSLLNKNKIDQSVDAWIYVIKHWIDLCFKMIKIVFESKMQHQKATKMIKNM